MMMNYEEAKRYMPIDKSLAAEAISAADEIRDEMKRRNLRPEIARSRLHGQGNA